MRGEDVFQESLFTTVQLESFVPTGHPLRPIKAQLLQVPYSIRSERQLVEQINYNLLYRWFVGLTDDDNEPPMG